MSNETVNEPTVNVEKRRREETPSARRAEQA